MVDIGTIKGVEETTNKDGDDDVYMLQVEFTNADDLQSVEQYCQAGEKVNPHPGTRAVVVDLGPSYRIAIAADDGVVSSLTAGEKIIYSYTSAGAILAYVLCRDDAVLELNGNTDFAVRYNELETAFNELKSDLNTFISVFNAHVHPGVTAGGASTSTTATPGSVTGADITPAKIDTIVVPEYVSGPPE